MAPMRGLKNTTIRDFGGGWNVADSDLNLNSRYQPVNNNVVRGIDGSFSVRQGCMLSADFADGTVSATVTATRTFTTTNTQPYIDITIPSHGRSSGDHITITSISSFIANFGVAQLTGTFGILVIDTDTIRIFAQYAADATVSDGREITYFFDNHTLGGNIIYNTYFNRRHVVFTDIGEVGTEEEDGTLSRIWGVAEADTLSSGLVGTRRCEHWSASTFKSSLIACNGYNRDKPIQIFDDFSVEFLVDKATMSNAAVPKADYVVCLQGYVCFVRTEFGDPFVEISARGTDGTFTREQNSADAVEVDLSMVTSSTEPVLIGAGVIRDKLYVAFHDKGMIGTLGLYTSNGAHEPDFGDTISDNGTVSNRSIVSLGNDIFMADYAGVPSVSISQQSGIFVPVRLSELIAPVIQAHLSSLSADTLKYKSFAVFNRNDRTYMLFLPIYDEVPQVLETDPLVFNDDLRALNRVIVRAKDHGLFANSSVTVSGASDVGDLSANNINGVRRVDSIIDEDTFVMDLGGAPSSSGIVSGGGNITIVPRNNQMIGYIFEFNKEFKIRRWTQYRGWNFDCGTSSQRGKVLLCKGLKTYRMGDSETPIHADFVNDYDVKGWSNNTTYTAGTRLLHIATNTVYICLITHTSPSTGFFLDYVADNPNVWALYEGNAINWSLETPWSDMKARGIFKTIKYINIDSEGYGNFTVSAFVNQIRTNPSTNELLPVRSMTFQAGDTGGWGIQNPGTFGSGRRTREEKVWPFSVRGKLIRWRYEGATTKRVRIISHTMYYKQGNIR